MDYLWFQDRGLISCPGMQSTQLETLGRDCSYSLLVGGLKLLPATIIGKDYNLYFACLMISLTGGGSQLFVATLAGSWERWSTDSYSKPRKWTWLDNSDDKVAFRWEKSRAVEEAEGCKPWLSNFLKLSLSWFYWLFQMIQLLRGCSLFRQPGAGGST